MTNLFEKSINLGIGLFVFTREKIEEIVEELVDKGEIAKTDAQEFTAELVKKGEEQRNEFRNLIRDEVTQVLNDFNIAKKEDIVTKSEIAEVVRQQVAQIIYEQDLSSQQNSK